MIISPMSTLFVWGGGGVSNVVPITIHININNITITLNIR